MSIPGYIKNVLHQFQHRQPTRVQHAPHRWNQPQYGKKQQLTNPPDTTAPLSPEATQWIQQIIKALLFYAQAVNSTLLVPLGTLAASQTKPTKAIETAVNRLLDYCASHPNATVRFTASGMILNMHSNASYLSEPKVRSRVGGHFFLSSKPISRPKLEPGSPTPQQWGRPHS